MSNYVDCPNCGEEIDATSVSLTGYCPECEQPFSALLQRPDDGAAPEIDYGPPEGHR
jgi:hypothetical protein